jgi:hypothetical protein
VSAVFYHLWGDARVAEIYKLTVSIAAMKRFSILSHKDRSSLELGCDSLSKRLRQGNGML